VPRAPAGYRRPHLRVLVSKELVGCGRPPRLPTMLLPVTVVRLAVEATAKGKEAIVISSDDEEED